MAAKIEYQRHKETTESIDEMLAHDVYLNDPTHRDHAGYTLMPGKNYNCRGETIQDLVADVKLAHANQIRRKKITPARRHTHKLWGECIFNLGPRTYINKEERDKIEREFIKKLFPDTAARATWHIHEESGKSDLHIIFAHMRPCGKLTLERTTTGLSKRMQALDRFAAELLNSNPDKPPHRIPDIRTSEDVAKADAQKYSQIREEKEAAEQAEEEAKNPKKKTRKKSPTTTKKKTTAESRKLAAQIAHQAEEDGIDDVEAHHLRRLLKRIGIKFLEIIGGIIKYESSRKVRKGKTIEGEVRIPRIGTIRIHDFLFEVLVAQVDLRIERDREKAELAPNAEPATPVEPTVESTSKPAVEATVKSTKTPAEKAAILEAFLKASLGRTKVTSKKLKSLTAASKRMLNTDNTIKSELLKSLNDDQTILLVKLAADYAEEMK
jgi:hypothetical protein